MQRTRSSRIGLVALGTALTLALLNSILPYVWDAILSSRTIDLQLAQSLHVTWIPLVGYLIIASTGLLGIVGALFLWRGRSELGLEYASRFGLAMLALVVAGLALALWAATGLLLGFVSGLSGLVPWRNLLAFVATVFLGFALYWILANLPLHGTRPVAAVAFALGVAGGTVSLLARTALRRPQVLGLEGAAAALSLASLVLWLTLCVWGVRGLAANPGSPPSAVPAQNM